MELQILKEAYPDLNVNITSNNKDDSIENSVIMDDPKLKDDL